MSAVYARHHTAPRRRLAALGGAALLACAAVLTTGTPAQAAPPAPVDAATARTYLGDLTVRAEGSSDGYSRDKFPHWSTQSGACNTREVVLKRDGTNVQQDASCAAVSGTWKSPYDGGTWTAASDVDIDHVVPLSEAWRSGASGWTTAQRQGFANDLAQPQLIAVTDNVNQAKGDKDPAEWMPPTGSYHCFYARMWVDVKHHYKLTVNAEERSALTSVLSGC
ncbi:HNH endonuclease family protein [Streptomyces sp. NRRL S-920]|uniref:HNH endonuclease family protein n=1 Tax=Streptomyces sp. NRRL S-920 TaxID=1463921 RepID=UPI0004C4D31A|nr:HNH endonuclease family protein [Streptomyces sp. NRRL S-920]